METQKKDEEEKETKDGTVPDIHKAKVRMMEFCQSELDKEAEMVRFVKITKSEEGWHGKVELTELNAYLKKIGYPNVFDKNRYVITLDPELNVVHFGPEEEEE